jgi:hypothetical protein
MKRMKRYVLSSIDSISGLLFDRKGMKKGAAVGWKRGEIQMEEKREKKSEKKKNNRISE